MTIKVHDKKSQWYDARFQPNEGPPRDFDEFAPVDVPPAIALRQFLDRETRLQAASTGSSTTLVPGKWYLRQQPGSGLWELTHNRGRGIFDCWVSESREEMLALAESLMEGSN